MPPGLVLPLRTLHIGVNHVDNASLQFHPLLI